MLYSCPNHELSREIIIQNFYARLSLDNRNLLDTSYVGSYMMKTIDFKWDLLERIKRNSEDWGSDDGKQSGMTPKFDCVKSFMDTDAFCGLFKLASMPEDVIKKKVFPLSLKGKALTWYRLLDDIGSWNYNRLKLEFH